MNVMRGEYKLIDAVVELGSRCPRILNCGNAGDYLAGEVSEKMVRDTFSALREDYGYIVVDTLPVSTSPFTLMLAREADGTLLVIESKKTKRDVAKDALDLLYQVGCNVLGGVLNRV
jgi:Mrp family chromosome partitioning ATPase